MGAISRNVWLSKRQIRNFTRSVLQPSRFWDLPVTPEVFWQGSRLMTPEHMGICPNGWPVQMCFHRATLVGDTMERQGNTDAGNANWAAPVLYYRDGLSALPASGWTERWGEADPAGQLIDLSSDSVVSSLGVGIIRIHGMDVKWSELESVHYPTTPASETRVWTRTGASAPDVTPLDGATGTGGNPRGVARLDAIVNRAYAMGMKSVYCLGHTPPWAASNPGWVNNWSLPGGGSMVADLAAWSNYVTWVCRRYQGKIVALELWNEPGFGPGGAGLGDTGNEWTGSMAELAVLQKLAFQAARAVDPTIKVLTPGFVGLDIGAGLSTPGFMADWLNTALGDGTHARDWIDGFAIHLYEAGHDWQSISRAATVVWPVLQAQMAFGGLAANFPVWNTECGQHRETHNEWFHQKSTNRMRGLSVLRMSALWAAMGVETNCWWHISTEHAGAPAIFPSVAKEMARFKTEIAGRTLTKITAVATNAYSQRLLLLEFSDGGTLLL